MITGVILAAVLTFNTQPPGRLEWPEDPVPGPVTVEGFHFIPSQYNQWVVPDTTELDDKPWMYTSPWLGFDSTMVVHNGSRFNLLGFDATGFRNAPGTLYSSNGDVLHYVTLHHRVRHYDLNWTNLDWIRFEQNVHNDFGPGGIDNLMVSSVDSPSTAVLTGIAGLLLFGFSRRMRWQ